MKPKVYLYAGCDTCRRAVKFLQERRIEFDSIPIREQPPGLAELRTMLANLNGDLRRLFNASGRDYRALGLGKQLPGLSEAAALKLLAGNGNLVKRPFVLTANGGTTGFKPDEWEQLFPG